MKISDNMSPRAFLWNLRFLRVLAASVFLIGVFKSKYFIDMAALSGVALLVSIIFSRRRANYMVEVYDHGDSLRFKMDQHEIVVDFCNIQKFELRDGKDGLDWISIHLDSDSKFGKLIQFYPDMLRIPTGRLDLWVLKMNERILRCNLKVAE